MWCWGNCCKTVTSFCTCLALIISPLALDQLTWFVLIISSFDYKGESCKHTSLINWCPKRIMKDIRWLGETTDNERLVTNCTISCFASSHMLSQQVGLLDQSICLFECEPLIWRERRVLQAYIMTKLPAVKILR